MKSLRLSHLTASIGLTFLCSLASVPAASMLGYYEFEDNLQDSSGNNNTAVASMNPAEVVFTLGFRGQGVDINDPDAAANSGGSVDLPIDVNPEVQPEVTFGGWVNIEAFEFDGFMATDNGGWDRGIMVNGQDSLSFGVASGAAPVHVGLITPGSWQYVVASFSRAANTSTLYVGDASASTQTTESAATVDTAVVGLPVIEIGRYDNQDLDGLVDDVFVVDDALDAHRVNAIRNLRLNASLDLTPLQAVALFTLFDGGSVGEIDGAAWTPTSGLDATNPGAVFDQGDDGFAVVLDDDGNGMVGGTDPFDPSDSDGDGMPDLWETTFFGDLTRDGTGDFDSDNLSDLEEFLLTTLPNREDTDNDGLLDGDEVNGSNSDNAATNPKLDDTDGDGLSDGDEVLGNNPGDFTSNPTLVDTDEDGFDDGAEVAALTDPRDAQDFPRVPAADLLAYYEFEDNFDDSSGAGRTAAPTQNPSQVTFTGGFRGQGADINDPDAGANSGGSINIPINGNPDVMPEISFGGWVNVEAFEFDGFMAMDNGGWDRGITVNGESSNSFGIASGAGPVHVGLIAPGSWQFVVGTFSMPEGRSTLYVGDDVEGTQTTESVTTGDAAAPPGEVEIEIGRYDNQDLDGIVDDIFVFGTELSAHQANAIRNLRLSSLDYTPADAAELFALFADDAAGNVNGVSWSPVSGLDAGNPGELVGTGSSFTLVLDDLGNGMQSGPAILFAITRIERIDDTVELDFNSRSGRSYAVDVSINLLVWLEADDGVAATGAITTFVDSDPSRLGQPTLYYRVRQLE